MRIKKQFAIKIGNVMSNTEGNKHDPIIAVSLLQTSSRRGVCLYTNTCARETHAQADGHVGAHTDRTTDGRAERQGARRQTSAQAEKQN